MAIATTWQWLPLPALLAANVVSVCGDHQLTALSALAGLSRAPGETARTAVMAVLITLAGTLRAGGWGGVGCHRR